MVEYKDTLLMPKTDFPMRGGLPTKEPQIQAKWDEMDINKLVNERKRNARISYCMTDHRMQTVISISAMH